MKTILICGALSAMSAHFMSQVADEAGSASGAADASGTKIRPNMENYQTTKSASGSSTKICGDAVSVALIGATLDETYGFVAAVVGTPESDLRAKYGDKNHGQQRMFLGNLIRGASASKDAEKKARVEASFAAELPAFRAVIDGRLAAANELKLKEKADKAAAAQKVKDDKAAEKLANAEKREAEAKAKKEAAKATAKPAGTAQPKATTQVKGPGTPAQPQ